MAETVRILVVEDDADQLEAYADAAREQSTPQRTIELTTRISAQQAKIELLSTDFDGAIVDLNLSPGNPGDASGNEVLLEITEKHRFPVLVVSGNPQNLDGQIQQSGFLKTFGRETPNQQIFDFLMNIYATGITKILGGRGLIERYLGEIFWKHIAHDFGSWNAGNRDSEKTLLRYTVAHLSEYLDLPSGADNKYYHEAEFYIVPPIRKHIATGDIVHKEGNRFIVVSPACDVAVRDENAGRPVINAESIVLAPIFDVTRDVFISKGILREDDSADVRKNKLDEIIKGKREKYVLLPEYGYILAGVADLQNPVVWTLDDFLAANRIATVAGAFLKDIQSRFAAYYGRQGQPDLDKVALLRNYKSRLSPQN